MTSSGLEASSQWQWPSDIRRGPAPQTASTMPGSFQNEVRSEQTHHSQSESESSSTYENGQQFKPIPGAPKSKRRWPPRTCRICLEVVNPTFHPHSENIPGISQASPSLTYDSSDPEAGRLLRPCKCKGSSKYVHEGCLQAWRHADPDYGKRNYWQCPTCGFRYRLQRMQWGRWVSSTGTQIILTISIFFVTLFVMGFVADPIINLYVDPLSIISSAPLSTIGAKIDPLLGDDDVPTWTEHFIKGLASLGLLGFVKVIFALSPWHWLNVRSSGIMRGGQSGGTGRNRIANISWIVVVVGVGTFLWVGNAMHSKVNISNTLTIF